MEANSIFNVTITDDPWLAIKASNKPPSFIDDLFNDIHEKIDLLFKAAESLGEEHQKVLDYKSAVANDIDFIEWLLKKGQLPTDPAASCGANRGRELFFNSVGQSFEERQEVLRSKSSVADKINLFEMILKKGQLPADPAAKRGREFFLNPVGQFSKEDFSSSLYEDETKEPRYLFVSNGRAICLLDLKLYRNRPVSYFSEVRPLPKLATLKLIENDLPVSVGLFKFGSNAFMIGGQKFQTVLDTKDCNLKGTSRDTYRLDLAGDGTLNPYLWQTEKLNSPKFWPIVELVGDEIHVFDSAPSPLGCKADDDWIFSHEVLGGNGHWREIPTIVSPVNHFITSHSVVGPRIYAVAGEKCLVFDSTETKRKWEACYPGRECWVNAFTAQTVWDILFNGNATCVREYQLGGKLNDSLYVLIALVQLDDYFDSTTRALAYLVTGAGQVVCMQRLPHFFEGAMRPYVMSAGRVIKAVDYEETLCAIVSGRAFSEECGDERGFLFINVFTVEELPGASSKVRKLLAKERMSGAFVEQEFVRVSVKDRYIYKTDTFGKFEDDLPHFEGMQACFF